MSSDSDLIKEEENSSTTNIEQPPIANCQSEDLSSESIRNEDTLNNGIDENQSESLNNSCKQIEQDPPSCSGDQNSQSNSTDKDHIDNKLNQTVYYNNNSWSAIESFQDLNISSELLNALKVELKIETPNPLQKIILPELIRNRKRNIFVRSAPHSGKKIAYLLTAIERVDPNVHKVQVVIIIENRELLSYTCSLAKSIAQSKGIQIDFSSMDDDVINLKGHIIFVTTDAWILFLKSRKVNEIPELDCLIIDELELMLLCHMSIQKLKQMISLADHNVDQWLLFSTCLDHHSSDIVKKLIRPKPLMIDLSDLENRLNNYIQLGIYSDTASIKYQNLANTLDNVILDKVLIFTRTGNCAEDIQYKLIKDGFQNVILVTENCEVKHRMISISNYNTLKQAIMIAQYPLTIGFRLLNLSMIINYEVFKFADKCESRYYHQIMQCSHEEEKPNFVINMFDNNTKEVICRLERKFGKMYKLETFPNRIKKNVDHCIVVALNQLKFDFR